MQGLFFLECCFFKLKKGKCSRKFTKMSLLNPLKWNGINNFGCFPLLPTSSHLSLAFGVGELGQ